MKKTEKVITEYSKNCPFCKKPIKGYSESQVKYNLEIHINAKHKGELNEDNNKKAVGTSDASNSKRNSK